jgi:hypothetical protein
MGNGRDQAAMLASKFASKLVRRWVKYAKEHVPDGDIKAKGAKEEFVYRPQRGYAQCARTGLWLNVQERATFSETL